MDVPVTELRAQLGDWVDRARAGEDIVVTDRGVPVARLVGLDSTTTIEQLTAEGLISKPGRAHRLTAVGRRRVRAKGSVSDLVGTQRG
jgi:prevent-host-death family protein